MIRMRLKHQSVIIWKKLCDVLTTLLFGFSGVMVPSLLTSVYFLSFLFICTWWGCFRTIGDKFAKFRIVMLFYSGLHLLVLYLYQFQFFQEILIPDSFYAR